MSMSNLLRLSGVNDRLGRYTDTCTSACCVLCSHALHLVLLLLDQVTEFLFRNAMAQGVASEPLPLASGLDASGRHIPQPATLFSNGHVRAEVAVQVGGRKAACVLALL